MKRTKIAPRPAIKRVIKKYFVYNMSGNQLRIDAPIRSLFKQTNACTIKTSDEERTHRKITCKIKRSSTYTAFTSH